MTSASDEYVSNIVVWNGIKIEVRYASHWCGRDFTSHLEIHALNPRKAALPMTETGYRSHFTPCGTIEGLGGPVAFATSWLERDAKRPEWRALDAASRQGSLF